MNKQQFTEVAESYLKRGFSIAPLKFREKIPAIKWEDFQTRYATGKEVNQWSKMYDELNIAVITGQISGITIVDIDGEDGFKSAEELGLPETLSVTTGKGRHLYYQYCDDPTVSNKVRIKPGIDIRNNGGYVVAPPSVHASGTDYKFDNENVALAKFPQIIIDLCKKNSTPNDKSQEKPDISTVREGSRNSTLTSLGGTLHHAGLDYDMVYMNLKMANDKFSEPLEESEVEKIARSICRYETNETLRPLTDLGVAERFFDRYHDSTCFCSSNGCWMIYNGSYWETQSDNKVILDKLTALIRSIPNEVKSMNCEKMGAKEEEILSSYEKFSRLCEAGGKLKTILGLCEIKLSKQLNHFDANPWIYNCSNVTFNLKDGTYAEHKPSDLVSKLSRTKYDPDAKCPTWEKFLKRMFNDDTKLIEYMQRAIGWSMTGDTSEQVFFILFGSGANGKSVFTDTIKYVLGDYARQAEFSTFLAKRGDTGARNDLASLVGARFVCASESSPFKTLDDAVIKQITGGEAIMVRFLYKELFEMTPHMKLFLSTNHKPNISDDSIGMWRRVRLIPCEAYIPPEERDIDLWLKLRAEASGILNWALEGLKQWKNKRLGSCDAVKLVTDEYQSSMDVLGRFLRDCTKVDLAQSCKSSALYKTYSDWCDDNGERCLSQTIFSTKIVDKKFKKVHRSDGTYWIGLELIREY